MITTHNITTKVFKNGNSRAVRLPFNVLKDIRAGEVLVLQIKGNSVVMRPYKHPRDGWDKQFKRALIKDPDTSVNDEYGLLSDDSAIANELDAEDWSHLDQR